MEVLRLLAAEGDGWQVCETTIYEVLSLEV